MEMISLASVVLLAFLMGLLGDGVPHMSNTNDTRGERLGTRYPTVLMCSGGSLHDTLGDPK